MVIRAGTAADIAWMARTMSKAVRATGAQTYTSAQVQAWASACTEADVADHLPGSETWIADDQGPVAFIVVRGDHVELLYTDPKHGRRGHATRLLQHVQGRKKRLTTEASMISAPVFARCGFRDEGPEPRTLAGVGFTNRRMTWP